MNDKRETAFADVLHWLDDSNDSGEYVRFQIEECEPRRSAEDPEEDA